MNLNFRLIRQGKNITQYLFYSRATSGISKHGTDLHETPQRWKFQFQIAILENKQQLWSVTFPPYRLIWTLEHNDPELRILKEIRKFWENSWNVISLMLETKNSLKSRMSSGVGVWLFRWSGEFSLRIHVFHNLQISIGCSKFTKETTKCSNSPRFALRILLLSARHRWTIRCSLFLLVLFYL